MHMGQHQAAHQITHARQTGKEMYKVVYASLVLLTQHLPQAFRTYFAQEPLDIRPCKTLLPAPLIL